MNKKAIQFILAEWPEEISQSIISNNSFCVGLFTSEREVIFANELMRTFFKGEPCDSFINPTFEKLLSIEKTTSMIFEGYLTIGDFSSVNTSIWATVYKKNNQLLVLGGINSSQLNEQNKMMHQLNSQISNLQRQLIKEKQILDKTLIQLHESNKSLEITNASKDKFFSIIAHDLKSPFNAIIGFSQLMTDSVQEQDYESVGKFSQIILQSSNRAMNLLSNLMEWAQSQTGGINFTPEPMELSSFIREVTTLFNQIAEQKSITIIQNITTYCPLQGDKEMIHTVMRNLISNAIKFTRLGGKITISLEIENHKAIISVADNGVGIPENKIDKLFKIDENYSTEGTQNETGTGLGLILCKEFIDKHGGTIWVKSELGVGSKFSFTLPY